MEVQEAINLPKDLLNSTSLITQYDVKTMALSKTRRPRYYYSHEFNLQPRANPSGLAKDPSHFVLQCLSLALKMLRQFDEGQPQNNKLSLRVVIWI